MSKRDVYAILGQETDEKGRPCFRCPCCGKCSYHPEDRKQGYCGACHWWTGDQQLTPFGKCPRHISQANPEHPLVPGGDE